jgi:hypothetical protein
MISRFDVALDFPAPGQQYLATIYANNRPGPAQ